VGNSTNEVTLYPIYISSLDPGGVCHAGFKGADGNRNQGYVFGRKCPDMPGFLTIGLQQGG
jgi:hypothetical protein